MQLSQMDARDLARALAIAKADLYRRPGAQARVRAIQAEAKRRGIRLGRTP